MGAGHTGGETNRRRFGFAPFAGGYEVGGLPARLIGVPWPTRAFFREEKLEGAEWIVCLDSEEPWRRYDPAPLRFLFHGKLDSPLSGERDAVGAMARVARLVDEQVRAGRGGVIHCALGIERTGALVGTVLALNGAAPETVADAIADVVEGVQPGWIGARFAGELAVAIRRCAAVASDR
jgi:hypothetical protein